MSKMNLRIPYETMISEEEAKKPDFLQIPKKVTVRVNSFSYTAMVKC